MIQIKDDEKSSPELQALIENEVKQLLKVINLLLKKTNICLDLR